MPIFSRPQASDSQDPAPASRKEPNYLLHDVLLTVAFMFFAIALLGTMVKLVQDDAPAPVCNVCATDSECEGIAPIPASNCL